MIGNTSGEVETRPARCRLGPPVSALRSARPSNAKMPVLTSRMWSSSSVASPGAFVSTTRSTVPSGARITRPYPEGSSSTAVAIVAAAPCCSCAATRLRRVSAVISGTSPARIHNRRVRIDVLGGGPHRVGGATSLGLDRQTWTVPVKHRPQRRARGCQPRRPSRRRPGSAAATGHAIIGSPHSGCSSFGVAERIRAPCPAARITTTGAVTTRGS